MDAFITSGLNQTLLGGGVPVNLTGFAPAVSGAVTWGTGIVFTDASAFPGGDSFAHANVAVYDQHGGAACGAITTGGGNTGSIATTGLNQADCYTVKVTLTSTAGCIADGMITVQPNATTCQVGYWSILFTTTHA